ncbi:multidrug efflux protein, outer membrane compone nt [Formosa agariphila KMM 3901]|uniref:Multidrug efflux protein, outer membrane compone nt n=1 Tax=Formosa agariphila (strain DSM 15362 / KCTC 12365 / LMG 23005 / KMM 3901 / M-2Alg 35-1) TaxID=1347342 RepID=T2KJY7_FORAG|nr:multidrug efflux protein, outer membrane compone nt [Formosa agariphila KMM 3901]
MSVMGQNEIPSQTLSFEEYLGYVKKYHPIMKQAELTLSSGEANLLKARGGFDPKIEVDYSRKTFKGTEYYDIFYSTFKVPTWYGIEFKANYENNSGYYLDPSLTVPEDGLYSAGVSFSLAQGLLIDDRMATLKKAKYFKEQSQAERDLLINNVLFAASKAYFNWLEASNELQIYQDFLENAKVRLSAVEKSANAGDLAQIDITEAKIIYQNRLLGLEAAKLQTKKTSLELSNYLWVNDIPMEVQVGILPEVPTLENLKASLLLEDIENNDELLDFHPKIMSLDAKIGQLDIDKFYKQTKLLPKLDLQYNFLTQDVDQLNSFNTSNYKAYVNFSMPLFLRKERGDLKLAKLKLQDAKYDRISEVLNIRNKAEAIQAEISSLSTQNELIKNMVSDYEIMVQAEERKFTLGDSSLFLINSREQKLIDAQLKENNLATKQFIAIAKLYNSLGLSI